MLKKRTTEESALVSNKDYSGLVSHQLLSCKQQEHDSLGPKSIFLVGKLKLDLYELFAWNALGARDIKKYFVFLIDAVYNANIPITTPQCKNKHQHDK